MSGHGPSLAPVAIVTGTSRGIGLSCLEELKSRGWLVAGFDLKPSPFADLSLLIDVSDYSAVSEAVLEVVKILGRPRGVVSAAGFVQEFTLEELNRELIARMIAVHLGGLINLTRATVPFMSDTGGSIVAMASELALVGGDNASHYVAAKGAILGVVRSLAVELKYLNITVNAVAPGPTDTQMLAEESVWRSSQYTERLLTKALVDPSEIAFTTAFLIENPAKLNGQLISPNAGTAL